MLDKATKILINPNYNPTQHILDSDLNEPMGLAGRVTEVKRSWIDDFLSMISEIFKRITGKYDPKAVERKIHSELSNLTRAKFGALTPEQQFTFCKNLKVLHEHFGEKSTLDLEIRLYLRQANEDFLARESRFSKIFDAYIDIYAFDKASIADLETLVRPLKRELFAQFNGRNVDLIEEKVMQFFNDFRLDGLKQKFGEMVLEKALSNLKIEGFIARDNFQKLLKECMGISPEKQKKEIAFIKNFVGAFLRPYIAGQVTPEQAERRTPMIVELQMKLTALGMNSLSKFRMVKIALKEYAYLAARGNYMRQNMETFHAIGKAEIKEFIQILGAAISKDFPSLRNVKVKKLAIDALNQVQAETGFYRKQTESANAKYEPPKNVNEIRYAKREALKKSGKLFF